VAIPEIKVVLNLNSIEEYDALMMRYQHPIYAPQRDEYGSPIDPTLMRNTFDAKDSEREMSYGNSVSAMSMLAMRMKWGVYGGNNLLSGGGGRTTPFDHISIHAGKNEHFVMIVVNDQQVTLKDPNELFPSDALVGSLILLTQGKLPT
jgi:hypothetical protein